MIEAVVTLLVGAFSGGTIAAIVNGIVTHRKGARDSDAAEAQSTFAQMQQILDEHRTDIQQLKADRQAQEKRLDDLAEENRQYRWAIVGIRDRLKQMPPLTPADILDYIREHVPGLGKDH